MASVGMATPSLLLPPVEEGGTGVSAPLLVTWKEEVQARAAQKPQYWCYFSLLAESS